jgi:hypothetical protein
MEIETGFGVFGIEAHIHGNRPQRKRPVRNDDQFPYVWFHFLKLRQFMHSAGFGDIIK